MNPVPGMPASGARRTDSDNFVRSLLMIPINPGVCVSFKVNSNELTRFDPGAVSGTVVCHLPAISKINALADAFICPMRRNCSLCRRFRKPRCRTSCINGSSGCRPQAIKLVFCNVDRHVSGEPRTASELVNPFERSRKLWSPLADHFVEEIDILWDHPMLLLSTFNQRFGTRVN